MYSLSEFIHKVFFNFLIIWFVDKVTEEINKKEAELEEINYEKICSDLTSEIILLTSHHDFDKGILNNNFWAFFGGKNIYQDGVFVVLLPSEMLL